MTSETITMNGAGRFRFKEPLTFEVERFDDGEVNLSNDESRMYSNGANMTEACESIAEDLDTVWQMFVLAPDDDFHPSAIRYRGWLKENVAPSDRETTLVEAMGAWRFRRPVEFEVERFDNGAVLLSCRKADLYACGPDMHEALMDLDDEVNEAREGYVECDEGMLDAPAKELRGWLLDNVCAAPEVPEERDGDERDAPGGLRGSGERRHPEGGAAQDVPRDQSGLPHECRRDVDVVRYREQDGVHRSDRERVGLPLHTPLGQMPGEGAQHHVLQTEPRPPGSGRHRTPHEGGDEGAEQAHAAEDPGETGTRLPLPSVAPSSRSPRVSCL